MADKHKYTLFGGARGPGKALALDTQIPTPNGWTTMGDVAPGDQVIGRDGAPCRVTWTSPVWSDRPCYRLTFDDGSTIIADAEHEWLVFSHADRRALVRRSDEWRAERRAKRPSKGTGKKPWLAERNALMRPPTMPPPTGTIRTTAQIAASVKVGRQESNWSIPTCAAFDGPESDLPLDPYVLGVWLGDGTSTAGAITTPDAEIIEALQKAGFQLTKWSYEYAWGIAGLKTTLRKLGLYANKHIPPAYLRASRLQRLALLQGMMDTDGYADKDGRVEFTGTNYLVVKGLLELVISLGYKATIREGRAMLDGRDCGPKWRVGWLADEPMFRLGRKLANQKTSGFRGVHRWRYVVECEPVESTPVRCIEVDSPDHLFLAGYSWIPTHNSYWLRWYCLRFLLHCAAKGLRSVRVMLASEDYPSLYERQISKVEIEFPAYLGRYHISRNEYRLAPQFGSGVIAFRNLDDAAKYMSAEFALMAVDEVTKNPEKVFHILRGSLRWPGLPDTKFIAASNPAPNWVRNYWIEHDLPAEMKGQEEQFAFVPALPNDNPHLTVDYWDQLASIPGALGKAWRYGDWYAGVEGLVYDNFTGENIVSVEPDLSMPFEVAVDDGYIDPRAILFIQEVRGGDILIFDELYQTKRLEEQSIKDVMAKCIEHAGHGLPDEWGGLSLPECEQWCLRYGVPLPKLAVASHEAVALRDRLSAAGIKAVNWLSRQNPEKGSTRLAAITLTRSMICDANQHRAIKIHRRCRNLLDEISMGYHYPEGKKGLEAEPEDGNDHAIQSLETWVWWHHGGQRKQARAR